MEARKTESNLSDDFQTLVTKTINFLCKHTNKNLNSVTRDDIISFLNSLRKSETADPHHKWIGTHNTYLTLNFVYMVITLALIIIHE